MEHKTVRKQTIECVKDIGRNILPLLRITVFRKVIELNPELKCRANFKGFFQKINNLFYCGFKFSYDIYCVNVYGVEVTMTKKLKGLNALFSAQVNKTLQP